MTVVSRQFAADIKPSEAVARPVPLWLPPEYKSADINETKGIITSYLAVYRWPDGTPHVDPYLDTVEPGAFRKTIGDLTKSRDARGYPYLVPFLWQHDRKEILGGVKALSEDSVGVIYESQLNLDVQRAREAFSLARERMIASSYGYDCIRSFQKGDVRHLTELRLVETSLVSFPANELATIIDTKDTKKHYVPSNMPTFPDIPDLPEEQTMQIKAVCGSTQLTIGPRDEIWDWTKARQQYKEWGMTDDGNVIADKWKQVHLFVDGHPHDAKSYSYPYCYISDGVPIICVDAVRQLIKSLKGLKTPEADAMRKKCAKMLERINTKYLREPVIVDSAGAQFDYKQDFQSAWTRKLPGQMLQEFFRMSDTLAFVLLSNFDDDDVADKAGSVDTCCDQFSGAVKDWLPEYLAAEEAQDALDETDSGDMMGGMYGMMGLSLSEVNVKHVADILRSELDIKEGRTLSERNKKKLRETIDNINRYLSELSQFVDGDPDTSASGSEEEPKHDITQDLQLLSTLTPVHYTSSTSQEQGTAPISFPTVPDADEVDITELLNSIKLTITKGGTEKG